MADIVLINPTIAGGQRRTVVDSDKIEVGKERLMGEHMLHIGQ